MKESIQKMINSKFGAACDKFCNSPWYCFAIGVVCIVAHTFDIPIVGAAFLIALLVPSLLFCKNSFVLVPFALMCSFVMSKETSPQSGYYNNAAAISILSVLLAFAVAAFVFNIVVYDKWKVMFKRAYLTVSFAVLTTALILGGIGTPSYSFTGLGMSIAIAATMFIPYSMLVNCGEYKGGKTVEYFAWAMISVSVVLFAAVIKQYVIHGLSLSYHPKNLIEFGYAISNTGAAFVLIAIPVTYYMVYKYKHGYLFMLAVALELLTIALTFSRASLAVAIPGTVIVAIVLCFKKKVGKLGYYITFGIAAAVAIILAVIYRETLTKLIVSMFSSDSTGSGRLDLWKTGFEAWKGSPIFGLNIWYLPPINNWYYSFHNTLLTYLYCTGIVGLLAYLYHRYKTVRLVFSAKLTSKRVFLALSVLAMLLNALLDIAMTMPPHLIYYGIMLALIDCDVKAVKAENNSAEAERCGKDISIKSDDTNNNEQREVVNNEL